MEEITAKNNIEKKDVFLVNYFFREKQTIKTTLEQHTFQSANKISNLLLLQYQLCDDFLEQFSQIGLVVLKSHARKKCFTLPMQKKIKSYDFFFTLFYSNLLSFNQVMNL